MATVERKGEVLGEGDGPTQGDRVGLSGGLLALSLVLPFYMPPEWSLWPSFMVFALSFAGFGGSFCQLLTVHPGCAGAVADTLRNDRTAGDGGNATSTAAVV